MIVQVPWAILGGMGRVLIPTQVPDMGQMPTVPAAEVRALVMHQGPGEAATLQCPLTVQAQDMIPVPALATIPAAAAVAWGPV